LRPHITRRSPSRRHSDGRRGQHLDEPCQHRSVAFLGSIVRGPRCPLQLPSNQHSITGTAVSRLLSDLAVWLDGNIEFEFLACRSEFDALQRDVHRVPCSPHLVRGVPFQNASEGDVVQIRVQIALLSSSDGNLEDTSFQGPPPVAVAGMYDVLMGRVPVASIARQRCVT